jgi:galactokinase
MFAELGYPVKGLNFTIAGDIPQQVGLASSSAIEAATAVALKGFFKAAITERELIHNLDTSKTLFFGENNSLVDYNIAFSAKKDQFLVVDESSLKVKRIKSPLGKYKLIIMDSRVPRMGVDEELKQRQKDIKTGLDILSQKKQGTTFRDFAATDLVESLGNLPEEIRRRSLHIVKEIRRVIDADESLRRSDILSFTKIISNSHESLRDLYEVSCPEIDWLVKRAQELEGVLASRMTGQGFGGCTYTFIKDGFVDEYKKRLEDYERIFGFRPVIYEMKLAPGCRLLPANTREKAEKKQPVHRTAEPKAVKRSTVRA